jgi:iron(III) transport system ATP-binding protein
MSENLNATRTGSLVLEGIAKLFPQRDRRGTVTAVDHISLSIQEGEFLTLLGPSGCGKTTTLRIISGFELPSAGRVLLDGKDITHQPPNKRDMAMVFQSYALFPHMTVFNNIAYGLRIQHLSRKEIRERVERVLDLMSLTGLASRRPNELSGGQQQRVALARSLVVEPRVLLFDEPLSNLDAKLRVQMRGEIRSLQRRLNITSVYVTHDQVEAMSLSDRIVVMNQGRIEQLGAPEEIYRYPRSRFVADFIGHANFAETQVEAVQENQATVTILGKTVTLPTRFPTRVGNTLVAVLRPEALTLRNDPALCQVHVEQAMYLGSSIEYLVSEDGHRFVVVEIDPRADQIFQEGAVVGIDFNPGAVHLLEST